MPDRDHFAGQNPRNVIRDGQLVADNWLAHIGDAQSADNWTGELRAVNDVMIDTVHYLARCGFNSFALKPGHDPAAALRALATFSSSYQRSYGPASR